ncbi:MAG: carboxypeptidase-like regulatory domain-containing protein [Ferruginibacter sp.]|nr:carboxypeptidase-like regulatory domain-containing protein [Bacteroidota bacterium]MBX2919456.1 carboxypeptidase-like regulatory domain-containing protein [Ferruginibacter sp.]MCC7379499.1 carboxypeptidase-like regulatory domain-containing protein [Chitinophagaceae bacterium]
MITGTFSIKKNILLTVSIFFSSFQFLFAQTIINGTVLYEKDDTPAAYANIELNDRSAGTMTDNNGNFKINISHAKNTDSIIISSVGYESIKLPVKVALKKSQYKLKELVKSMEGVTVFKSHETMGIISQTVGYYRSWSFANTGGEIGRIFTVPYKKYKIDKVRFKAANLCDTCQLRVHIRKVVDGVPGDEIISDTITTTINKLTLDDKVSEFDLTPYDYTFTQHELFVSMEVLGCSSKKNEFCSFSFAGTDKGEYMYKSRANADWNSTNDYTIFLKLLLRY